MAQHRGYIWMNIKTEKTDSAYRGLEKILFDEFQNPTASMVDDIMALRNRGGRVKFHVLAEVWI